MRSYFPKRTSGVSLHTASILWCSRWYYSPTLFWSSVLLYLQSPKGGCCSISDGLSRSFQTYNRLWTYCQVSGGFHTTLQRVQLANRERLLTRHLVLSHLGLAFVLMFRTFSPELVMFSYFEYRTSLSTSILPFHDLIKIYITLTDHIKWTVNSKWLRTLNSVTLHNSSFLCRRWYDHRLYECRYADQACQYHGHKLQG